MTPYSLECREEGPSLPSPTARKARVDIRGFGSDLRVVTGSHRSWPTFISHRGSQARVTAGERLWESWGTHPSAQLGGPGLLLGRDSSLYIVRNPQHPPRVWHISVLNRGSVSL